MTDRPTDTDCIFCSIVTGDVPSRTVDETEDVLAFLDVNPLAPGHTLIVPKGHYETVDEIPSDVRTAVFEVLGILTPRVEAAVDADASNLGVNNGSAAGQEIPHAHAHIIPRFEGDGGGPIHRVAGSVPDLADDELDDIAERIREA